MGVGKIIMIDSEFKNYLVFGNYVYVDIDEIMGMLKGFELNKVEDYYLIVRNIFIIFIDWILEQKISFVVEGICVKYMEFRDYMYCLKIVGYYVCVKCLFLVLFGIVIERLK